MVRRYIKWAYASFVLNHGLLDDTLSPTVTAPFAVAAYMEHERVWNRFKEPDNASKSGPQAFIETFHHLLRSIARGFSTDEKDAIPACSMRGPAAMMLRPLNGAHRIASALALGVAAIPVKLHTNHSRACAHLSRERWNAHFFESKGYTSFFSRWVMTRAIAADPALHVLHIWPSALARGPKALSKARDIINTECSIDGGILYEARVPLSAGALSLYLRHAYGDVTWIKGSKAMMWYGELSGADGGDARRPLHLFVLRSNITRLKACKQRV